MTDNNSDPLPLGTVDAIGKAAEFNQSTALHDRRSHSQRLGAGMFNAAADFAGSYKQHHPEAADQITRIATFAFKPKPAGYVEYMDRLVMSWLSGSTTDTETNAATVQRIRDRFPNHSFAGSLLNKPLSKGRLQKIAANATEQGFKIDTLHYDTLSKIKAAAKAKAFLPLAGNDLLIRTVISGDSLIAHGRVYKIEAHGNGRRLNFRHNGKQINLRIDHLEAFAEWLAGDDTGVCPSNLLLQSIEIGSHNLANPQQSVDPPLRVATPPASIPEIGSQIPASQPELTIIERTAALRAHFTRDDATTHPPGYDPLCDL